MKVINLLLTTLAAWPLIAWEFMLAVGIAHRDWYPLCPLSVTGPRC